MGWAAAIALQRPGREPDEVELEPRRRSRFARIAADAHAEHAGVAHRLVQLGAECGALGADSGEIPHDLRVVVDSWPALSESIRGQIVAMVREALEQDAEASP